MQSKAPYVLRLGRGRRAAKARGEVLDPLHVVMLGLRCELADRHVFDHAPTQRADGLLGHGDAPVLSEVVKPLDLKTGRTYPPAYELRSSGAAATLPRERFSPLAQGSRRCYPPEGQLSGDKLPTLPKHLQRDRQPEGTARKMTLLRRVRSRHG